MTQPRLRRCGDAQYWPRRLGATVLEASQETQEKLGPKVHTVEISAVMTWYGATH